jgi:D-3-phosphoglycerate dehydrogenase / 2-oxoglutarate reductase
MPPFKVALVGLDNQVLPDWVCADLAKEGIDFVFKECVGREELRQVAGDADLVWVFGSHKCLTAENLDVIPRCGAILRSGSGTDNIPVAEATERGIIVANTPEAISDSVSNHAIGLLFAVTRQIAIQDRLMRAGKWDRTLAGPGWHMHDQTLGLVGFGHIAKLVARKMSGFEMTILAHDPYVDADTMASYGVSAASLDDLLSRSDYVSVHCPLLKSTYHLIGERELKLMKKDAILVNTSRGPVIDEPALIRALTEGWIAGAGLDVFEQEPIDPFNPLLKLDNVAVTPHIASNSDEFLPNFWRLSVDTVVDLAKGRWPRSYVNKGVKPRWQHLTESTGHHA